MPCYHPRTVWKSKLGPNKSGKIPIVFDIKLGIPSTEMKIPCGQCIGCRLERSRQWAVRCLHESKMHVNNCFITLTYNNDELKRRCGVYDEETDSITAYSLNKKDFVQFIKALRQAYTNRTLSVGGGSGAQSPKIRYFHCGEYGDRYGRPHHHACLFNFDFQDKVLWQKKHGTKLYVSQELNKIWGHGNCLIGEVTFDSAAYVARYVCKKITGKMAEEHYDGIQPEYCSMSLKPGIGSDWLKKFAGDAFNQDCIIVNGHEAKPPRFYDKKYDLIDPVRLALLKQHRKEKAKLRSKDSTAERLLVREHIKSIKMLQCKRSYEQGE